LDACLSPGGEGGGGAGGREKKTQGGATPAPNQQYPAGKILGERAGRYYLQWDFRGASGKFALRW